MQYLTKQVYFFKYYILQYLYINIFYVILVLLKYVCSQISFITPKNHDKHGLNLKNFVRTILRSLFTYSLTSNYSWRGFRGNFQIGNLKIIKIIFGMYNLGIL